MGTWLENAARFSPGMTVAGWVRGVKSYGTFVELTPNLTGLADQTEGLAEDDRVSVYIKAILPDRMKIKLTLIHRLEPEPGPGTSFLFYHIRSTLPLGLFSPRAPGTQNTDGLRLASPLIRSQYCLAACSVLFSP